MNTNVSTSRFMARNSGAVLLALFFAGCQLFGVSAYREVCELILIDRSIPAVIHRKTFRGPEPLSTTSISQHQAVVVTPVDLTELRNYIMKLPGR